MPSSQGSSRLLKTTVQRIVGYTGPTGPMGVTGQTGSTGSTGYGQTGSTGPSLVNISLNDNKVVSTFNDNVSFQTEQQIKGPDGNYLINASGSTLSNKPNFFRLNATTTYDGAIRDILYFKNLATRTPGEINIVSNENDITVTYTLQDVGNAVVTGGEVGQLLINIPGNDQVGLTGSFYNEEEYAINVAIANVSERLEILNGTRNGIYSYWTCDPDRANIFYISQPSNTTGITTNKLILKNPSIYGISKSITVVFAPNTLNNNPILYQYTDDSTILPTTQYSNINWPTGDAPCLSGKYDIMNFIYLQGSWYGYVLSWNTETPTAAGISYDNNTDRNLLYSCNELLIGSSPSLKLLQFGYSNLLEGITYGICCNENCGYTGSDPIGCTGYFVPGVTYQAGLTLCDAEGACCIRVDESLTGTICQELKYCECSKIANESNLQFKWTKFDGIKKTCDDFDCYNSFKSIGACCNGSGECFQTSEINCDGYWQGSGVKCVTSENLNVCYDGYGACCDSGITCENNISGATCFSSDKTYFGDQSTCDSIDCSIETIPCFSIIPNNTLKIGDVYENGIVVGIFNPNGSKCFGNSIFGDTGTSLRNYLITGSEEKLKPYNTIYDYSGYGQTLSGNCDVDSDSYILLMSIHPVTVNSNKEIVEYFSNPEDTNIFKWSNGSDCSWGPMINPNTLLVDNINVDSYKEGYLYNYNISGTKKNVSTLSFPKCQQIRETNIPDDWFLKNPNTSFNGKWYRNWGFMNTSRIINSEYYYYAGISMSGIDSAQYEPEDTETLTISRAVSLYNKKYPQTNKMVSDWYVPSHDELAFIANSCIRTDDLNINTHLLLNEGTVMNGWYWSSTGTFTKDSNEMLLNHPDGLKSGSSAWAIYFDSNSLDDFLVSKKQRSETLNLRLVRMIRCDGKYKNLYDSDNKYWKLLLLDEEIIGNI